MDTNQTHKALSMNQPDHEAEEQIESAGFDSIWSVAKPIRSELLRSMGTSALSSITWIIAVLAAVAAVSELLQVEPERDRIWWLIIVALCGVLARFGLNRWSSRISHMASFQLEQVLRGQLVDHLATIPLGKVQQLGAGGVKKIIQDDVRQLHAAVADATPMAGFALSAPIFTTVVLFVIDWRLALVTLSVLPVLAGGMSLAMRDYPTQRQLYADSNERINAAVVEYVQGMQVVRVFDDGTVSSNRFAKRVDEFTKVLRNWQATSRAASTFSRIVASPLPSLLLITIAGTAFVIRDWTSVSDLAVFLILGTTLVDSFNPIMVITNFLQESRSAALRIREILDIESLPEPEDPASPADGAIELRSVTFSYGADGRDAALKDVNITIPTGSVCALVGPSGSGKSTVARLIPRFWDVDSGSILVGGVAVRQMQTTTLLRHVALVFQDPVLLHRSIRENISLGRPDASFEDIKNAARAAQAHDFIMADLPDGYNTVVGERGTDLSGGQRQRITIARAILSPAPIVILDEATAFADPENEAAIQAAVAELVRGRTLLVIAHRLSTIMTADQIVVLAEGQIAESGTHEQLLDHAGVYANLWEHHQKASAWGFGQDERTQA